MNALRNTIVWITLGAMTSGCNALKMIGKANSGAFSRGGSASSTLAPPVPIPTPTASSGPSTPVAVGYCETAPSEGAPWLAQLLVNNQLTCTGALVGNTTALFAAHCLDGLVPANLKIVVGTPYFDYSQDGNAVQLDVSSIYLHENYSPMTFENDVALVQLDSQVAWNSTTCAVRVPTGTQADLLPEAQEVQIPTLAPLPGDVAGFHPEIRTIWGISMGPQALLGIVGAGFEHLIGIEYTDQTQVFALAGDVAVGYFTDGQGNYVPVAVGAVVTNLTVGGLKISAAASLVDLSDWFTTYIDMPEIPADFVGNPAQVAPI
ncbi:MAG: trypsin-like serine protease [Bacteriovoracia bacterium]